MIIIQVTEEAVTVDLDECGKTKGCLMFPSGCTSNCRHVVTYSPDEDSNLINFEVMSHSTGYVTVSLTDDKKMVGHLSRAIKFHKTLNKYILHCSLG